MLLSKKSLLVAMAASKDCMRESICSLRIEPDGTTIATDGHILVKYTPKNNFDTKDYPVVNGINIDGSRLLDCTISNEAALKLAKQLPKKQSIPIINDNCVVDVDASNGGAHLRIGFSDLDTPTVQNIRKMQVQYPDYTKVIPNKKPTITICMGVVQLEKTIKTLKALGCDMLTLELFDADSPLKITATTKNKGGEVVAVVMPRRLKERV